VDGKDGGQNLEIKGFLAAFRELISDISDKLSTVIHIEKTSVDISRACPYECEH
jgi:hypothetical protein